MSEQLEHDQAVEFARRSSRLDAIDALLPPCPTCGGDRPEMWCPDCVDGKVPIERLVKVFEAAWNTDQQPEGIRRLYHHDAGFHAAIHYLRCIK